MTQRRAGFALLLLSTILIAWATLTPNAIDPVHRLPPAWCVYCGARWLTDVISNVVLFLPFGIALALCAVRVLRVAALSLIVSLVVEYCQFIGLPSGRSAAIADIVTNTLGGVIGALLVWQWRTLLHPTRPQAATFALLWSAMSTAVFAVTAFALSDYTAPPSSSLRVEKSSRTHTPNYGWYGGLTDSARVGDLLLRKGSGGPIIMRASHRPDSLNAMVAVRGRDVNTAFVPLLYLHVGDDSSAIFIIGQHNGDAELRVTRRAFDIGLNMPTLTLPGVFTPRAVGDTSTLVLTASATSSQMTVSAVSARDSTSVTRALTLTLGWVLIQTLFDVESPIAPLAVVLWLAALVAPIGYWAGCYPNGDRARVKVALLLMLPVHFVALMVPVWHGVARWSIAASALLVAILVVGAIIGWTLSASLKPHASRRP